MGGRGRERRRGEAPCVNPLLQGVVEGKESRTNTSENVSFFLLQWALSARSDGVLNRLRTEITLYGGCYRLIIGV